MPKYKVKMIFTDGEEEMLMADDSYDDAIFDNESDAEEAGLQACGDWRTGSEILFMSNPGDYPYDENTDDVDYKVIEIDD